MKYVLGRREVTDQTTKISITVNMMEKWYDVNIFIPKGTFKDVRSISCSNGAFKLNLESVRESNGPIKIELKRNYKLVSLGLVEKKADIVDISTRNVKGTIKLYPNFYIMPEKRATVQNLEKAELLKHLRMMPDKKPKTSSSKQTQYKVTNIDYPYNGGKVSPK